MFSYNEWSCSARPLIHVLIPYACSAQRASTTPKMRNFVKMDKIVCMKFRHHFSTHALGVLSWRDVQI